MLLAELEVWHSRPIAPTRRVALGHLVLPTDPAPGLGGLLLAAVVAAHTPDVDDDYVPDVHRLLVQVENGERIVQPRLRHRFQVDRHGLARSYHALHGDGEQFSFEFHTKGTPLAQLLGAVYALERLDRDTRRVIAPVLGRAMRWRGPLGPAFVASLMGSPSRSVSALLDPVAWALEVLGFPPGTVRPSRRDVTTRFRAKVREVHPDVGGNETQASRAIAELAEARRLLDQ